MAGRTDGEGHVQFLGLYHPFQCTQQYTAPKRTLELGTLKIFHDSNDKKRKKKIASIAFQKGFKKLSKSFYNCSHSCCGLRCRGLYGPTGRRKRGAQKNKNKMEKMDSPSRQALWDWLYIFMFRFSLAGLGSEIEVAAGLLSGPCYCRPLLRFIARSDTLTGLNTGSTSCGGSPLLAAACFLPPRVYVCGLRGDVTYGRRDSEELFRAIKMLEEEVDGAKPQPRCQLRSCGRGGNEQLGMRWKERRTTRGMKGSERFFLDRKKQPPCDISPFTQHACSRPARPLVSFHPLAASHCVSCPPLIISSHGGPESAVVDTAREQAITEEKRRILRRAGKPILNDNGGKTDRQQKRDCNERKEEREREREGGGGCWKTQGERVCVVATNNKCVEHDLARSSGASLVLNTCRFTFRGGKKTDKKTNNPTKKKK
ncbi:hypothetical protein VP01_303g2 [Puccinia sorghi]|uniref:Uncharacterized protein n=1 Tax=Puccinia sorghi TaxID=27349 RepID=A0A0L6V034_9BASI|nr:hypothetical protein VP01_303g2 [Puccinia sorghi]